jgi:hypothetical protein
VWRVPPNVKGTVTVEVQYDPKPFEIQIDTVTFIVE